MPRGPYHERFRHIAEESDNSLFHLMVQCRVLLMDRGYHTDDCYLRYKNGIMAHRTAGGVKEQVVEQMFVKIGNVTFPVREGEVIYHLPVITEKSTREVKSPNKVTIYSEPMYLPILDTTNFNEEVWKKSPKYVKRMYNATFIKKIHLYGHIWLPFVKKVGPVVEIDDRCQFLEYMLH